MRLLVSIVLFLTGPAAWACSLCSNPINRATLSEEMDLASVVVCGKLANPRLGSASQPGAGTTDLHIDEVLKDKGLLGATRQLTLSRYLPVADPKQPPRYLVFLEKYRDKLEPIQGIPIKSPAVIAYVKQAQAARTKGRIHALEFFGQHFDDADDAVAWDAFMEFAKSKDADVGEAARRLDPARLRKLLDRPGLDADRFGLFAFLLGCCGTPADADVLLKHVKNLDPERQRALDGILAGYLNLRPAEGWKLVLGLLASPKEQFATRFAALRTVRFYQGWKPTEYKGQILTAMTHVLDDGELADLAAEDLRRWKWWDLTKAVVAQYGRPTHTSRIVQHSLIRYALSCPLPEAREMVVRARRLDPEFVADQEQLLKDLEGAK